jgi:cell division protein FtsW (lipid II flippase)
MSNNSKHNEEKRILWIVYATVMLAFAIIALYNRDWMALLVGLFTILLTAYAHFIIKRYFPDGDKYILILSAFLAEVGMIMLYRIKPYFAFRQITWFTIGIAFFILIVVLFPDLEGISNLKYVYMGFTLGLLLLTQIFGKDIRGSRNWIDLGIVGFQPSEFSKVFLILYLSSALKDFKSRRDLLEPGGVVFACLVFLVLQKDLGTAMIFFAISITMVYIATSRYIYALAGFLAFAAGGAASYAVFAHVRNRVQIWLNPWADPTGKGYQIVQSLFAIASGGFLGTGLCLGHPQYIPEVETDFIFSIICEEFGLLGGFAIIIAYFLLVYRGFRTAIYAPGTFSRLAAVGISTMIGAQVFVIIGGVIKLIPLTGITLPLISYGGSSLFINFAALGLLQKISESDPGAL